jgi:hypothetical protein
MKSKYLGGMVIPFAFSGTWYVHKPLRTGGFEESSYKSQKEAIAAANRHNQKYSTCYVLLEV